MMMTVRGISNSFFVFVLVSTISFSGPLPATDWPCYKADASRSGATRGELEFPLSAAWIYEPAQPPNPAWPEPGRELHRIDFDYAFQPVIADGLVYFGSSVDDTVRALDAVTGKVEWRFTTDGPVRFAPHIADGKCYLASDDGFVYCLVAATGKLKWKFRAAPEDRQIIGNGRMISRWPCRSGVLVLDGVAYVTSGMWPSGGIYVYALDAQTGKVLWCNDTSGCMYMPYPHGGAYALGGVAPQGYLLASKDVLLVPTGRSVPAGFDRRTGRFLYYNNAAVNKSNGGCWATIWGDIFFNPCHGGGPDAHISRGESPPRLGDGMLAHSLATGEGEEEWRLADRHRVLFDSRRLYAIGKGKVEAIGFKGGKRGKIEWTNLHPRAYSAALAGDTLLVGGADTITAINTANGRQTWRGEVEGQVRGLAIADGRIFAATEKGTIYCFAGRKAGKDAATTVGRPMSARKADEPLKSNAAADIVKLLQQSNITKGYALIIGRKDARLAEAIASRTQLHVISLLRDKAKVAAERQRLLDTTDLYGSRMAVQHLEHLKHLPYAQYFANVVVVSGGTADVSGKELYRVLRPYGGLICFAGVDRVDAEKLIKEANIPGGEVKPWEDSLIVTRGKLEGALDWDSEVTSDHRVKWPLELLWFGGPAPDRMINRHWHGHAPIPADGRYFAIGEYHIIAVDAYNGRELWARELGHIFAHKIPVAADDKSVYVNFEKLCLELDAQTGNVRKIYGNRNPSQQFSLDTPQTFALKVENEHSGTVTLSKTDAGLELALITKDHEGTGAYSWDLFFDFRPVSERVAFYGPGAFELVVKPEPDPEVEIASCDPGLGPVHPEPVLKRKSTQDGVCVVLELSWDEIRKLTGSIPGDFAFSATLSSYVGGLEPLAGARAYKFGYGGAGIINNGWATFVLDSTVDKTEPSEAPAVPVGKLEDLPSHARRWGRMPHRGEGTGLSHRIQPLTAETVDRIYRRAYGCGGVVSSAAMDFFRSGTVGFYDLIDDSGMRNFGAIKPGCGETMVPALGLLFSSEGSAGCTCSYSFQTSFALAPAAKRSNEDWAVFYDQPRDSFLRRVALNLGAPGDRRDDSNTLWLGFPRPQSSMSVLRHGRLDIHVPFSSVVREGFGPYRLNADRVTIAGAARPWVYASGLRGVRRMDLDLERLGFDVVSLLTDKPPRIDGRHSEPCWDGKKRAAGLDGNTSAWFRHDKDNLYVAYKQPAVIDRRGAVTPWKAAARGSDASVWEDDAFELYLSDTNVNKCLHLGVSASGARYDALWVYVDPLPTFDIPRLDGITIDGKVEDWGDGGFQAHSLVGEHGKMRPPENFDPSFRVGWNDKGLLLLVQVRDDVIYEAPGSGSEVWRADSVEILMTTSRGMKEYYQFDTSTGADPKYPELRTHFWDKRGEIADTELTAETAAAKTRNGYLVEMLLPWKNLEIKPALGTVVGLQMFINDSDGHGGYPKHWFRALWHQGGHPGYNPEAYHQIRLALEPSRPARFKRGDAPGEDGLFTAVPPYPFTLEKIISLGRYGEDSEYSGNWFSAVQADKNAFTAELTIPWKTLAAAGLEKDKLVIDLDSHGQLRAIPSVGQGFELLSLDTGEKVTLRPFTVRLHFAEIEKSNAGERVFSVKLQDQEVLKDFDIAREAGGPMRAIVKEFNKIKAGSTLTLSFEPKIGEPLICGIEVIENGINFPPDAGNARANEHQQIQK